MPKPLDSVQAKLKRAWANADAFNRAYHEALDADPIRLGLEPDAKPGYYIFKIEYVPELPPIISAILGDILHNFRSALDHLVWQLALLTNPKPSRSTMFPISANAADFRANCYRIADLDPAHQAIIERHQPYNRGDGPLRALSSLINRDKHQELNLVMVKSIFLGEGPTFYGRGGCSVDSYEWLTDGHDLEVNAEIARLRLSNCKGEPQVRVEGHLVPGVELRAGNFPFKSIPTLILMIGGEIVLIVEQFERILEPRPLMTPSPRRWPSFSFWPPSLG